MSKVIMELDDTDISDIIDEYRIAEAIADDITEKNPEYWANKIYKHIPKLLKEKNLDELIEESINNLLSDLDIEHIVMNKISEFIENELQDKLRNKILEKIEKL